MSTREGSPAERGPVTPEVIANISVRVMGAATEHEAERLAGDARDQGLLQAFSEGSRATYFGRLDGDDKDYPVLVREYMPDFHRGDGRDILTKETRSSYVVVGNRLLPSRIVTREFSEGQTTGISSNREISYHPNGNPKEVVMTTAVKGAEPVIRRDFFDEAGQRVPVKEEQAA